MHMLKIYKDRLMFYFIFIIEVIPTQGRGWKYNGISL